MAGNRITPRDERLYNLLLSMWSEDQQDISVSVTNLPPNCSPCHFNSHNLMSSAGAIKVHILLICMLKDQSAHLMNRF